AAKTSGALASRPRDTTTGTSGPTAGLAGMTTVSCRSVGAPAAAAGTPPTVTGGVCPGTPRPDPLTMTWPGPTRSATSAAMAPPDGDRPAGLGEATWTTWSPVDSTMPAESRGGAVGVSCTSVTS